MKAGSGDYGGVQTLLFNHLTSIASIKKNNNTYYLIIENEEDSNDFLSYLSTLEHIELVNLNSGKEINLFYRILKKLFSKTVFNNMLPMYRSERVANKLSLLNLDVIHFLTTTIDLPYRFPDKTKIILTVADLQHEYLPENFTPEDLKIRKEQYSYSINKANSIVAISNYTADTISEKFNVERKNIDTVYHSAPRNFFTEVSNKSKQIIKNKYKLPDNFLFYPGHPWKHKNHIRLLKAIIYLKKSFDLDISLVVSGQLKNAKESIESIAEALSFPMNKIYNIGFIDSKDLPAIYSLADLLVYPSLYEGFGIPVLEAFLSKCPVVCSNLCSLPEVGGDSVVYVNPYSYKDIAKGIYDILKNDSLKNEKVMSGLLQAKQFDEKLLIEQYLKVYNKYS